jgi:dipeptidyl aminopeptidase/acylaminoacyl peptidase
MDRDLRRTPLYREIKRQMLRAYGPAFGRISGAADPVPAPDGRSIAFAGSRLERLDGLPHTRIAIADVATGGVTEVTAGPHDDRLPRWSPDGAWLAFLSDRARAGHAELYLLAGDGSGAPLRVAEVDGTIEYHAWSPDGRTILYAVAGAGADLAGAQGSGTTKGVAANLPAWMPEVDSGVAENQWRRLWLYDRGTRASRALSRPGLNIWEAVWAGPDHVAAIVSTQPGEDAWYTAPLALIDVATGHEEIRVTSARQLGLPAASPSGRRIAFVQAVCSDRGVIAGDLLLLDRAGGAPRPVETSGVDVGHLAWRDEDHLFFAGLRGLESIFGEYNVATGTCTELWATHESSGNRYPVAAPVGRDGFALVLEGYDRFPELALVRDGRPTTIVSFAHAGSAAQRKRAGTLREVAWPAPDGLEIQGLLVVPDGPGPHPVILHVHGGPVWAYRNRWALGSFLTSVLVSRGFAVLHPNPRGSTGRGQAFAEAVYGEMGGAETGDHLAALDWLVGQGIADPARLGVMGGSHGGFMTTWIITQSDRFAAAVAVSPVTDFLSQHYTSNIGFFDRLFLQDEPANSGGKHYTRSPIQHVERVKTPTLQTAGALDRCTPPTQAVEFHHALLEHGVEASLAIYPQEGHGVRQLPAAIDYCSRVVAWFERFMPARHASGPRVARRARREPAVPATRSGRRRP